MKITITKDVQPCLASGWSLYKEGDKIDLRRGNQLVDQGFAVYGWDKAPEEPEVQVVQESPKLPVPDNRYAKMSTKAIRAICRERDLWQRGLSREEMIALMEKNQG